MEWLIALGIVVPALLLVARGSPWLVDYVIWVFAFNRLLRRLVDYYLVGAFNPFSPISLSQLIVAGLLVFPFLRNIHYLPPRTLRIFILLGGAVAYGFLIGFVRSGFAAVYALAEWVSGIAVMGVAATMLVGPGVADRWVRSWGWAGLFVAAYGWYQYYVIPPWDAFWVEAVGFVGYLGQLRPTEMTVFSSLPERGPCSAFLIWAVIPMILADRWRIRGGWVSALFVFSVVPLTYVRTVIVQLVLTMLIHPVINRGRAIWGTLVFAAFVSLAGGYALHRFEGGARIQERLESLGNLSEDGSVQGRIGIVQYGAGQILTNPIGFGLGSSGIAGRVNSGDLGGNSVIMDSGYLQIFAQFGLIGTVMFFSSLWLMWKEWGRILRTGLRDTFVETSRTLLLTSLALLVIGDAFAGFSLVWLFFGRALFPLTWWNVKPSAARGSEVAPSLGAQI